MKKVSSIMKLGLISAIVAMGMSGCSDFGKELGGTLIDSLQAGFDNKPKKEKTKDNKSQEYISDNEKIWNKCMEKNRKKISHLFYGESLEAVADSECDKELGQQFKHNIDIEKRKHAPDREKRIASCMTKLSYLKTRARKTCEGLANLRPYRQCVMEYEFLDINEGKGHATSSGFALREDRRCNHLK